MVSSVSPEFARPSDRSAGCSELSLSACFLSGEAAFLVLARLRKESLRKKCLARADQESSSGSSVTAVGGRTSLLHVIDPFKESYSLPKGFQEAVTS